MIYEYYNDIQWILQWYWMNITSNQHNLVQMDHISSHCHHQWRWTLQIKLLSEITSQCFFCEMTNFYVGDIFLETKFFPKIFSSEAEQWAALFLIKEELFYLFLIFLIFLFYFLIFFPFPKIFSSGAVQWAALSLIKLF